uniref:Uncharacterized protein n=1 Tax=Anopheles quadriannulatus TaxID=34691 RepID=A0A182XSS4_ANOQN
ASEAVHSSNLQIITPAHYAWHGSLRLLLCSGARVVRTHTRDCFELT